MHTGELEIRPPVSALWCITYSHGLLIALALRFPESDRKRVFATWHLLIRSLGKETELGEGKIRSNFLGDCALQMVRWTLAKCLMPVTDHSPW